MSDTTNTPEERDGRATVATGDSAEEVDRTTRPDGDERTVAATPPAGPVSNGPAQEPDEPGPADEPTAVVANGRQSASTDVRHDEPPTVVTPNPADRTVPGTNGHDARSTVPGPRPAPGPVPGPGPDAAPPPPWNRVPGQEPAGGPRSGGPVADLLGDGPTMVMGAPGPGAEEQHRTESGPAGSGTGSWQAVRGTRNRTPRQAALQLKRLDPWSVLKLALVLAVVLFFIWLVAVGVLYGVLGGLGVWDQLNGTYANLVTEDAPSGSPLISAGRVFGLAAVVGAINSLLFAVAMTIAAFVYNVSADLVGGVEVTLSERD